MKDHYNFRIFYIQKNDYSRRLKKKKFFFCKYFYILLVLVKITEETNDLEMFRKFKG